MDPVQVLAAERRRRILALVWDQELGAGDIAAHFEVSWPAISQHLGILRDAGFVTQRRAGNRRYYRAVPEALGSLRAVVEDQWRSGLRDLKHLAESQAESQAESPTDHESEQP